MNKLYIICLILLSTAGFAAGEGYFDIGGGTMPLDPTKTCTYMSTGRRFHIYKGKVDLSVAHHVTPSCQHYLSGQMLMTHHLTDHCSIGLGSGIGSLINYEGKQWRTAEAITVEATVSCQLPKGVAPITPALQCGMTQPVYLLHNRTQRSFSQKPACHFSLRFTY